MLLNHEQIVEAVRKSQIVIDPFEEANVEPASYDVRLGAQAATVYAKKVIDVKRDKLLALEPGDTAVVVTLERIQLDNQHVARLGLRSRFTRRGIIGSTGPQVDPGFKGRLILTLTNLSPNTVVLQYGEALLSLEFHRLSEPTEHVYDGDYQEKLELGPEELEFILKQESMSLPVIIKTLGILAQDVKGLANSVNSLKWSIPIIVGFGMAIVAAIVAIK